MTDLSGLKVKGRDASEFGFVVYGPDVDPKAGDAMFYCDGDGSKLVATVGLRELFVQVRCDGQMRVHDVVEETIYTYSAALMDAGYRTDDDLYEGERTSILYAENNPWFDLYGDDTGEHLDAVRHDYKDALEAAFEYLLDNADTE
jgi:hypothetical protein